MKRFLLAGSCMITLVVAGCSSTEQVTDAAPVTTATQATATVAAAAKKRQPSEAQVSMYVRGLNEALAPTGESMELPEAMQLAASMCEFLDGGNSPYDAVEVFTSSGVPEDVASKIVPLAMGAACNQHLTTG